MKCQLESLHSLHSEGRWDIDYHLPPEGIKQFHPDSLKPISYAADIVKTKRDPTKEPDEEFIYIDISSVDVNTGVIVTPQELLGVEAPSRARKVVNAYDLIISTCRPTRGAISVIPEIYHDQICSTGFSVIRPKKGVNPFYLHFAVRLASTLEQFRKFSTGSSYPAILDSDVKKTLIPLPDNKTQDLIAGHVLKGLNQRQQALEKANVLFHENIEVVIESLSSRKYDNLKNDFDSYVYKSEDIALRLRELNQKNKVLAES
jgi:restriction endonuclease S subunit